MTTDTPPRTAMDLLYDAVSERTGSEHDAGGRLVQCDVPVARAEPPVTLAPLPDADLELVIYKHTGEHVSLAGLPPGEKVSCLLLAVVNPETYNGAIHARCLVGQALDALLDISWDWMLPRSLHYSTWWRPDTLAQLTGADTQAIRCIFVDVAMAPLLWDAAAALAYAQKTLQRADEERSS